MHSVYKKSRENQQRLMDEYDNINKNRKDIKLSLGQIVYIKAVLKPKSLDRRFEGPFQITKVCRKDNYVTREIGAENPKSIRRHISHLYAPKYITGENLIN